MNPVDQSLVLFVAVILCAFGVSYFQSLSFFAKALHVAAASGVLSIAALVFWEYFSKPGRERRKRIEKIREIPSDILAPKQDYVFVGEDQDLKTKIHLTDSIRSRHVHILGATGSGKTESVVLNFLKQDVNRGLGAIILDAKGDASFLEQLEAWVPEDRRKVFDLGNPKSLAYHPLLSGTALESAQRLFASMIWSEEYYKSKAFSALQRIFEAHFVIRGQNPTLVELAEYLDTQESFAAILKCDKDQQKAAFKDYGELSGLIDQVRSLCLGHLKTILSPSDGSSINLEDAAKGRVIYFRLQSLMSSQLVGTIGRLVINHLSYMAGCAHRETRTIKAPFVPTYLDEFATFACPEFADLISKARSAGFALHFSHQSIGDLQEVSPAFLGRITDNSATKIVLRINDPDSAEMMSRAFGTSLYQKTTQRITNAKDIDRAEVLEEGTQREAHQFRASPDLLKTHPTGVGSVLIAHGQETPHGASSVFRVRFPRLPELTHSSS